jgi:hypothetical protein
MRMNEDTNTVSFKPKTYAVAVQVYRGTGDMAPVSDMFWTLHSVGKTPWI